MMYRSLLRTWNLHNKRVLLRIDGNVPLKNNQILDDYKLQAIRPTLDFLHKQQCYIIIATHIGRPQGKDYRYSTQHLLSWFKQHNYSITFSSTMATIPRGPITLLENLRFHSGEKKDDHSFAQNLADTADYYVNDAFAILHRKDTSITKVPLLFPKERRSIGFLIEKELDALSPLIHSPLQPFVLIIGGGKVHDKLPLLNALLDRVHTVLICPAISFTFSKVLGKQVGNSLVDTTSYQAARTFLENAHQKNVRVLIPIDYQVARDTIHGPLSYTDSDKILDHQVGISIGPKTINLFNKELVTAKTIFLNGLPGFLDRPETLDGIDNLLKTMASVDAYSIIGGGDTVAAARKLQRDSGINYCSTGGGATLTYLSGKSLPGLKPFTTYVSI